MKRKEIIATNNKKTIAKKKVKPQKKYLFATIVSVVMFFAMALLNLLGFFIVHRYPGDCECPMCWGCSCDCGTIELFKEYFFYYPVWLAILMICMITFACCLPTSKYLRWLRIIPFVFLLLIVSLIVRGLLVIM